MKNTILFSLLCLIPALAAPVSADQFSPDSIVSFTRWLIGRGEYYRALVELKRLNSYYPGHIAPSAFHTSELYILARGGQHRDILDAKLPAGDRIIDAAGLVFRCDAAIGASDAAALGMLVDTWRFGSDPFFDRCMKKRRVFLGLVSGRYGPPAGLCGPPGEAAYPACRELIAAARDGIPGEKRPWLAAVLGIVPGAGYLYAGEYATGIFAFLLIAADAVLTYFAFRTGNEVIGYFTGAVGGLLYAGSMAGGYLAARRFNVRRFETAGSSLAARMDLEGDREEIFRKYGIGTDGTK